jgi:hypothetical protein
MLVRKISNNKIIPIQIGYSTKEEQEFININPTGGFKIVKALPFSVYSKWKETEGVIVVDIEEEAIAEQEVNNKENRKYLSGTDWYITRNTETGVKVPADILTKRQICRENIV